MPSIKILPALVINSTRRSYLARVVAPGDGMHICIHMGARCAHIRSQRLKLAIGRVAAVDDARIVKRAKATRRGTSSGTSLPAHTRCALKRVGKCTGAAVDLRNARETRIGARVAHKDARAGVTGRRQRLVSEREL